MKATQDLKNDHEYILRMLAVMSKIGQNIENGNDFNIEHIEQAVDFVKNFADKFHHGKEEEILFVEMEKAGMSQNSGPIAVMLHEHVEGRNYIKNLTEAIAHYKNGNIAAKSGIVLNAKGYVNLLDSHIAKEDNILFGMADDILNTEKQNSIFEEFTAKVNKAFSIDEIENYRKLVEKLEKVYF